MKKIIFFFFLFCSSGLFAQQKVKVDTVYYLLDTAKTPEIDRMWTLNEDGPLQYTRLNCPCVNDKDFPVFIFRVSENTVIKNLNSYRDKLVSLPDLIKKYKRAQIVPSQYYFMFFVPQKEHFLLHPVKLDRTKIVN